MLCRYGNALRIGLVKLHLGQAWQALARWSRPEPLQIRKAADDLTNFFCKRHLPHHRARLADQAAHIKVQLDHILGRRYDPSELPPMVFTDDPAKKKLDTCLYSPLLRMESVRPHVLAAWLSTELKKRTTSEERKRIANHLLRMAMRPYADDLLGANVAHYTTLSGRRSAWEAARAAAARRLCGADTILVKALVNTWGEHEMKYQGETFRVPILEFLEEAHQHARTIGRRPGPIFEATGQGHADLKAGTCYRILSFLGEKQDRRRQQRTAATVSLNALAAAISGSKGGKRYEQIKGLAEGLHLLGLIRVQKIGRYNKIALAKKRVKYLRRSSRGIEALAADPT
jgi:hypothetical protein